MKRAKTEEGKVAEKIIRLMDSLTLDLELVGEEIGKTRPTFMYNRFIQIAEAAVREYEK